MQTQEKLFCNKLDIERVGIKTSNVRVTSLRLANVKSLCFPGQETSCHLSQPGFVNGYQQVIHKYYWR